MDKFSQKGKIKSINSDPYVPEFDKEQGRTIDEVAAVDYTVELEDGGELEITQEFASFERSAKEFAKESYDIGDEYNVYESQIK